MGTSLLHAAITSRAFRGAVGRPCSTRAPVAVQLHSSHRAVLATACGADAAAAAQTQALDASSRDHVQAAPEEGRRAVLLAAVASATAAALGAGPAQAGKPATRQAGDFCKPGSDGYVVYTPDDRATPSIRAGVIRPNPDFYSFEVPPAWTESTILNILSGNFCMPRCDEPFYEVVFESPEEGKAKLVVSPLYRLISKSNATLKDLGPPEQVVESIGAFITGNYLDSVEDVVAASTQQLSDGRTYYMYELLAPYAKDGAHLLAALGIKGDLAYLWVVSASEKQWAKSEGTLRHMVTAFKA